jgi:hypothetical protein
MVAQKLLEQPTRPHRAFDNLRPYTRLILATDLAEELIHIMNNSQSTSHFSPSF